MPRTTLWKNCQTLCYYDPDLPVSIETDASQSSLIAVLLQNGRPISFMSKALTATQPRYSNIEHEILGIVTGVKAFPPIPLWEIIYIIHRP